MSTDYQTLKQHSIFIFLALAIIGGGCANVVAPSGGERDEAPPEIIKTIPENFSIFTRPQEIVLHFNEYIALKDPANQIYISPSLNFPLTFKIKQKKLILGIKDTLLANTTYSVHFLDAIADITEGNKISQFSFVFSTGDHLDSLKIKGTITTSPDNKRKKGYLAVLHANLDDSAIVEENPTYISKTNENGEFFINNIKEGTYNLFCIKELSGNLKYDLQNEMIGFADTVIDIQDTIIQDFSLVLFLPDLQPIQVETARNNTPGKYTFAFNRPFEQIQITPESPEIKHLFSLITEHNDSVTYWFTTFYDTIVNFKIEAWEELTIDNSFFESGEMPPDGDTIRGSQLSSFFERSNDLDTCLYLQYNIPDSAQSIIKYCYDHIDVDQVWIPEDSILSVDIRPNISNNGFLSFYYGLALKFDDPVLEPFYKRIILLEDSTRDTVQANFIFSDSIALNLGVNHKWKDNKIYQLIILDSAIKDIYGNYNQQFKLNFVTGKRTDFGKMELAIQTDSTNIQYILSITERKRVISSVIINNDTLLKYAFLRPSTYTISIVEDLNNNRRWDTGSYQFKRQPERIREIQESIKLRANWTIEEKIDLGIIFK